MSRGREAPMDFEMTFPQSTIHSKEQNPWLFYASSVGNNIKETNSSPSTENGNDKDTMIEKCKTNDIFVFGKESSSIQKSVESELQGIETTKISNTVEADTHNQSEYTSRKRHRSISPLEFKNECTNPKTERKSDSFNFHTLPYVITGYVQLLFTLFIASLVIYILLQFVLTVRHDLEMKAEEYSTEIMHQVAECTKLYMMNRCEPHDRIPAVEKLCKEWETCMKRDPKEVGRLKVGAETLAEILNKLVDPLSYKTMAFGIILILSSFLLTNMALSIMFKFKNHSKQHPVYVIHSNQNQLVE